LSALGVTVMDQTALQRLVGYMEVKGNVKKLKVAYIMSRVNDRAAMRQRIEENTMKDIATYM